MVQHRVQRPLHIASGEWLTVLEFHSRSQVKNIGQRIGRVPRGCKVWLQVKVRIFFDERIKHQLVDTLRLSVHPDAWIEIGRAAFNRDRHRIRISRFWTAP